MTEFGFMDHMRPVDLPAPATVVLAASAGVARCATLAELEPKLIGEWTKAASAVKRAQGARLGRPQQQTSEIVETIVNDRSQGLS